MRTYTITKDNGITKVQNAIKKEIADVITTALVEHFGSEDVATIRTAGTSPTNEICIRVAEIIEDGFHYEQCVTVPVITKTYKEKVTSRYTIEPFDFISGQERFKAWQEKEAKKVEERAKSKTKNKTTAKKAEQAQRAEEVKQALEAVKAKQNA